MKLISDLVSRYERGGLSRRDLIQGLTLLVATAAAKGADSAPETAQLNCSGVDHVSVRVKDLKRSAEFYQSLFGLEPRGEDKEHRILRLGKGRHVIVSLRQDEPYGQVDHFGLRSGGRSDRRLQQRRRHEAAHCARPHSEGRLGIR